MTKKNPATQFALGLCNLHAEELDAAILHFENALRHIKAAPAKETWMMENNATYIKLNKKQIEQGYYLTPFDFEFCTAFPRVAEQTVLLAMIYAYQKKGMADKALRLSSGLVGSIFDVYKTNLLESSNGN